MRILIASHNFPRFAGDPAGAFVARIADGVAAAGHAVRVLAPHAPGTAERETRPSGVVVRRFRYAPGSLERVGYRGDLHRSPWWSPVVALGVPAFVTAFAAAIRSEVATNPPDVIHAHWWLPAGWLASTRGVPYVLTCHGSDVRLLDRSALWRRVAAPVFTRAAAVTTVSNFLAADVRRSFPHLARAPVVTPMPVPTSDYAAGLAVPKGVPPRILYAGNLIGTKGVADLVAAFATLRARGVSCGLKILGEGPELGTLRALAAASHVEADIIWSRFVPQSRMPAEYGASTVTVLPTLGNAEGLGLTLVEALLAGSAVVGTHAGGIPEVIEHGVTGLLARGGDCADLAEKIESLLIDDVLRERLTRCGRERVAHTYGTHAVARFVDLYHDIADRHSRA